MIKTLTKVQFLAKKYNQNTNLVKDLLNSDPAKGKSLEWLVRQVKNNDLRWSEDRSRLEATLEVYYKIKRSPRLLKQHDLSSDLNQYTFHDLEQRIDNLQGKTFKSQRQTVEEQKQLGTKVIYDNGAYKVIQIGGNDTDITVAAQAASIYAKGTKWCTSDHDTAISYLEQGALYIIFKDGEKLAQTDGDQLMDVKDHDIKIKNNVKLWEVMKEVGIISYAKFAYLYARDIVEGRWVEGEAIIATDSEYAYLYAKYVIEGRWVEGEAAIMIDPGNAYFYAKNTIKGRWVEGEATIAACAMYAHAYACYIIKGRWVEGEAAIATDPQYALHYAREIIKGPWHECESFIATDSHSAYEYARDVIKGRWLEGEAIIATDPRDAYFYVKDVIKDRWVEGEAIIATNSGYAYYYARYIIEGRWAEGESIIATDSYYACIYAEFLQSLTPMV